MTTILSLFSGCGGFDLGALRAGHTIIGAYELDPSACVAYEQVTGVPVHQADLTRFHFETLPDAEGWIAGPPCQDFSLSGSRAQEHGERNLFPHTIEAIRVKRPAWVLLENVVGFAQSDYFHVVIGQLVALGYAVEWRILNAADYGVPQTRRRVFIAARCDGLRWCWPQPTHHSRPYMFIPRLWNSWSAHAPLLEKRRPVPFWITSRMKAMPESAFFSRQFSNRQQPVVSYRLAEKPAFTLMASDGTCGGIPVIWQGEGYRVTEPFAAAIQTIPNTPALTMRHIGNAVPPLLAQALLQEVK